MKGLLVQSNSFSDEKSDKVSKQLFHQLELQNWKEFFLITPKELDEINLEPDEINKLQNLIDFQNIVNSSVLNEQIKQSKQAMNAASAIYSQIWDNLAMAQNFVTAGVTKEISLNQISKFKTNLLDLRDDFIEKLKIDTYHSGESVEEDLTTYTSRKPLIVIPAKLKSQWFIEPKFDSTSFRQQLKTLQLDSSRDKIFFRTFVETNLSYINFVSEKKKVVENEDGTEVGNFIITYEKKKNFNFGDYTQILIQNSEKDKLLKVPLASKKKEIVEVISKIPMLIDCDIFIVKDQNAEFSKNLIGLENKLFASNRKYGVLYIKPGQTKEDIIFSNSDESNLYLDFLSILGDRVPLKGWKKFSGGLDTKENRSGTHSIYTEYEGYSIMFHVATMLPLDPGNEEHKLERKRHIANDVCCILFLEEGATFDPTIIRSEFVHVYILVSPIVFNNREYYRIEIVSRNGVSSFKPQLPRCIFPKGKDFKNFLITKLINSEQAATDAPAFKKRITRTRSNLINDLINLSKTNKLLKSKYSKTLEREVSSKSVFSNFKSQDAVSKSDKRLTAKSPR